MFGRATIRFGIGVEHRGLEKCLGFLFMHFCLISFTILK